MKGCAAATVLPKTEKDRKSRINFIVNVYCVSV